MAHGSHAGHFCLKVCLTPSPTFSLTTMETPSRCKSNISHSLLDKSGEGKSTNIDSHLFLQLPLFMLAAVSGLVNINHSSLFRKRTISKWWLYCRLVLFVSFLGCVGSCRQSRCLVALVSDVMMLIRKPWSRKWWRWEWNTNKEEAVMSMFPLIGWCLMLMTMLKDDDWRWWDDHI